MWNWRFWLVFCGLVVIWAGGDADQHRVAAQPPARRAPVPDAPLQEKSRALFRELYGDEYDRAKTAEQKTALAAKLLEKAAQIQADAPGYYVLLVVAGEIAAEAGDANLALEAADRLGARFDVDAVRLKATSLRAVGRKAKSTAQFRALAEQVLPMMDAAVDQDDFDSAQQLGVMGAEAARRARQFRLAKQIFERSEEVEEHRASRDAFERAVKQLDEAPTDPEANLTAGRYLCFVKGQWQRGVSMLALGSDAGLKSLASKELQGVASADARVALGDAWWAWAADRPHQEREEAQLRAGAWYQLAQSRLASGLVREKVAARLEEVARLGRPIPPIESVASPQTAEPATISPKRTLEGHEKAVTSVVFSPDGRTLASADFDGRIKIWDVGTGRQRVTTEAYPGEVCRFVAFSPDGKLLASGGKPHVKLWNAETGKLVRTLEGHTDWIGPTVFSPDGRLLASGGGDDTVRFWDVATGRQLAVFEAHPHFVFGLAFSPDGTTVASGGGGGAVKLWEVPSGKLRGTLNGHRDRVWSLAYSPDGSMLISGSADRTAKVWDMRTRQVKQTLKGHDSSARGVAFSPDGRTVATVGYDFRARLWDAATGRMLAVLKGHTHKAIESVAFSPDGKLLASGGHDKTVRLWDVPPQ